MRVFPYILLMIILMFTENIHSGMLSPDMIHGIMEYYGA